MQWKQDWYQISHWQCQIQEDKEIIAQKSWEPLTLNLCKNKLSCLWRQNLNNLRELKNSVTTHRLPLKGLPYNVFQQNRKRKKEFIRKKWDINNNAEQIKQWNISLILLFILRER